MANEVHRLSVIVKSYLWPNNLPDKESKDGMMYMREQVRRTGTYLDDRKN